MTAPAEPARTGWAANPLLNALVPWVRRFTMSRENFDGTAEHDVRGIEIEWLGFVVQVYCGALPRGPR